MPGKSRYDVNPTRIDGKKDITEYLGEMLQRLGQGETVRRIGATSIEDGNLTVRNGDIIVSQSTGTVVWRLLHGDHPEMRWFPIGEVDDHRITFFSDNDAIFNRQITMYIETNPGSVVDGGKVILSKYSTVLSCQPLASGYNEVYIWLDYASSTPSVATLGAELIDIQGRWNNAFQSSSLQGIYTGQQGVGSGFTSYTHTYASSFSTLISPVVGLMSSGGTVSWNLTAQSTSSFTVTWTGTTSKTINWWNFRV